jgi:VanZ family protein
LIKAAIGLSFTKVVNTFTGRPNDDEMVATFVSALVACISKSLLLCTGWEFTGVILTPMLEATINEYLQSFLS